MGSDSQRDQLAARLQDGKIRVRSDASGPVFLAYVHDCDAAAAWFLDALREITGTCAECKGTGMVDGDGSCNCGSPADISVGYSHERYCGAEPCPAGCPVPAVMPGVSDGD